MHVNVRVSMCECVLLRETSLLRLAFLFSGKIFRPEKLQLFLSFLQPTLTFNCFTFHFLNDFLLFFVSLNCVRHFSKFVFNLIVQVTIKILLAISILFFNFFFSRTLFRSRLLIFVRFLSKNRLSSIYLIK